MSSIFDIPHIVDTIAESFTFSDLLNCNLVNKSWHATFVRILWTDVITWSNIRTKRNGRAYKFHFRQPESISNFQKYAHHIRALTCRSPEELGYIIQTTTCVNLLEINYIVEEAEPHPRKHVHRSAVENTGLLELMSLMDLNPKLRAVSIEKLGVLTFEKSAEDLLSLVKYLDTRPLIQCFYLSGHGLANEDGTQTNLINEILKRRLDLVKVDNIRSLALRDRQEMMRHRRGPPSDDCGIDGGSRNGSGGVSAYEWPGRELRLKSLDLTCQCIRKIEGPMPGRWEWERRKHVCPLIALAVLGHKDVLEVCIPQKDADMFFLWIKDVLGLFPNLTRLNTGCMLPDVTDEILDYLPKLELPLAQTLTELQVGFASDECLSQFLVKPNVRLTRLSILGSLLQNREQVAKTPYLLDLCWSQRNHFIHNNVLVRLDLSDTVVLLSQVLGFLTESSQLALLRAHNIRMTSLEDRACSEWTCSEHLKSFSVAIFCCGVSMTPGGHNDPQADMTNAAKLLAPSFMAQVGKLTKLRELELRFNEPLLCSTTPFLCLDADDTVTNGLGQLRRLNKLEKVVVSGVLHTVGDKEITWMAAHWPRLKSIELPVLDGVEPSKLAISTNYEVLLPDYQTWFPNLKVVIPPESWFCRGCKRKECLCDDSSDSDLAA
ncbi:hypothetical protein BG004_004432 [Podila humilis]|nr:hypothetical protein BG004_004432 [Podila humilis]